MRTYSYLGPAGTFTEAALAQVPEAQGQTWKPVANVAQALADVADGTSDGAMLAIENTVEGGGYAPRPAFRPLTRFEGKGLNKSHVGHDLLVRRR